MSNMLFNVSTLMNQNSLRMHNKVIARATERLSTGSCINQAKDDPFRNYETKNVDSEIHNIGKARQNSADGASLLQIAEGTCNEVQSILQRIRELSVQSANDTLTSTERSYLNIETEELLKEIDRIADSSNFNSKRIFGNRGDSFSDEQRDLVDWKPFTTSKDADGNPTRAGVLHIGHGTIASDEVKISIPELSARSLGLDTLSITYQNGATRAIDDIDTAMSSLNLVRSYMGSIVNRMDSQVENLDEKNIGLNDYTSKISDTDVAKEVTDMTSAQIRQQAAISVLAQSNSKVSRILEMLG